jgi:hypothetical protein
MSQHSTQRKTRRWVRLSKLSSAVGAALGSVWLVAGATDGVAARPASVTPAVALLSDIPSHNRAYRASMIASPDPIALNRQLTWIVEVRTASGAPVEGAALALESWMPDDSSAGTTPPRLTQELGSGRYRVEGLRFDRRGWWNVRLRISAASVTDSLAFNLVL